VLHGRIYGRNPEIQAVLADYGVAMYAEILADMADLTDAWADLLRAWAEYWSVA
jgi:hypothetical protein